jgi:hypothetical protein
MTTFCLIRPAERLVALAEAPSAAAACESIGLDPAGVDHGVVLRGADGGGLGIIVGEWSLMQDSVDGQYWSLERQLFNGPAVLYVYGLQGETLSMRHGTLRSIQVGVRWLGTATEAERAVAAGDVQRPQQSVNDEVIWEWKGPTP